MPIEQKAGEILEQAVHAAFPDRSRAMLREIDRWFWEWEGRTRIPAPERCGFCARKAYQIGYSREVSRKPELFICDNCLRAWGARFNDHWGGEIPGKEMILADVRRALQAATPPETAEPLLRMLEAQAAMDRHCAVRTGTCDRCHAPEERPLLCSGNGSGLGLCTRCLMLLGAEPPPG